MNGLDYYKSLISDDEVIKALVKESKAREGQFEKVRVRPNMNFFQRTVSNMVSSNKRITTNQEKFTAKQQLRNSYERKYIKSRQKNSQEYKEELLSNKVDFIKSSTNYKCTNVSVSNDIHKQDRGNLISKRKKPKGGTHENDFKQKDHPQTQEGVDHSIQIDTESDSSVLCLSGDNSVITIDSDDTEASKDKINNIEHLKKRRKLLKKKRKKLEEHLNSYKSKKNSKTHKKKSKDKC